MQASDHKGATLPVRTAVARVIVSGNCWIGLVLTGVNSVVATTEIYTSSEMARQAAEKMLWRWNPPNPGNPVPLREAVRCWTFRTVERGYVADFKLERVGDVPSLAIDDHTGGGLVERVRQAVDTEYREWHAADKYSDDVVKGIVDRVLVALGVTA